MIHFCKALFGIVVAFFETLIHAVFIVGVVIYDKVRKLFQ